MQGVAKNMSTDRKIHTIMHELLEYRSGVFGRVQTHVDGGDRAPSSTDR